MPTGYTAKLYDGEDVSFRDFVLTAARGMAVAIFLRDYDMDVVPTAENINGGRDESTYSQRRLVEVKKDFTRWMKMTSEEVAAETEAYNEGRRRAYDEALEKDTRLRRSYGEMLQRVKAWVPPTPDHESFKDFMIQQLESSIEGDCGVNIAWYATRTPEEHREQTVNGLIRECTRLEEQVEKETESNATRRAWVQALYESLDEAVVA